MCGLLPRASLGDQEGLFIAPTNSVHTFFMRFPMDAAFLDRGGKVVALYDSMKPWRISGIHFSAVSVLETGAGVLSKAGVKKGEVLEICLIS
jgi:uncharacterized protein